MRRRRDAPPTRGLFDDRPDGHRREEAPIGPARVPDAIMSLATALPEHLRLGTSSWSFPGWAGIVYDRPASAGVLTRRGLAAYARHPLLRAVGVDRTYYAPVSASVLAEYAEAVPEQFRFLVKAASLCTDPVIRAARGAPAAPNPTFLDPSWTADRVVAPYVDGLGPKAGALLFQFPPLGRDAAREPGRFAERLGRFLEALPRGPAYAVELRDRDLAGPAYEEAIEAAGASHCVSIHPRTPPLDLQRRLAAEHPFGPLVVRWMLHSGLAYEEARDRYSPFDRIVDEDPASRGSITAICVEHLARGREVLVIANNKAEGSAPLTQFRLAREIAARLERPD